MAELRWSIPLEGDILGTALHRQSATGRLLVSTTRRVSEAAPAGLWQSTGAVARLPDTTYVNSYPLRVYAVDPDGSVAWTRDGLSLKDVAPDGRIIATNDRLDLVVLDPDGRTMETRTTAGVVWRVVGYDATGGPVLSDDHAATWRDGEPWKVADSHLLHHDATGELRTRAALSRSRFEEAWRGSIFEGTHLDAHKFPAKLALVDDRSRGRWIGYDGSAPAWLAAIGLDGVVAWVVRAGDGCCNYVHLVGEDAIAHVSACGFRISFVSPDGVVLRTHKLDKPPHAPFSDGANRVCVPVADEIRSFDARGEQCWSAVIPGVERAIVEGGVLYAVTAQDGVVTLGAFRP